MPTIETARLAANATPPMPLFILALTLKNGTTGYFTGNIEHKEGQLDPGIAVSIAAHESAAAELLDHAWRGPLFHAYRLAQAFRDHGLEGMAVDVVEYHPAGAA